MWTEFDDQPERRPPEPAGLPATATGSGPPGSAAGLLSRLYARADATLRADMLACLLRPLGLLSIVGAAAGGFAGLLHHHRQSSDHRITGDEVVSYSPQQVSDLARFVQQVDPQALRAAADTVVANPTAAADLNATTLARLYKLLDEPAPGAAS